MAHSACVAARLPGRALAQFGLELLELVSLAYAELAGFFIRVTGVGVAQQFIIGVAEAQVVAAVSGGHGDRLLGVLGGALVGAAVELQRGPGLERQLVGRSPMETDVSFTR